MIQMTFEEYDRLLEQQYNIESLFPNQFPSVEDLEYYERVVPEKDLVTYLIYITDNLRSPETTEEKASLKEMNRILRDHLEFLD